MSDRLSVCAVCGSGVMHKSIDGVTCGDQICKDRLPEKIEEFLDIEKQRDSLDEQLTTAESDLRTVTSELAVSEGKLKEITKLLIK